MKTLRFSPSFQKKLSEIKKRDKKLFEKVRKQLKLFSSTPQHPSLRLHKLKGELQNVWSISLTMSLRMLFIEDEEYYFFDIGTHDEVYRK